MGLYAAGGASILSLRAEMSIRRPHGIDEPAALPAPAGYMTPLSNIEIGYARNIPRGKEVMPQVTVGRWGKNLAIRFPGEIAKAASLNDGERVEIEAFDGDIVIRRPVPRFALEELFKGKSAKKWRAAYAGAFDWGPDVGREIVEE
jgi:antitoxin MazE